MKKVALVLTLLVSGCGGGVGQTNVAAGVTLASAIETCEIGIGTPDAGQFTDSLILIAEAQRDSGVTEASFLEAFIPSCVSNAPTASQVSGCISCVTQIAAAVWN